MKAGISTDFEHDRLLPTEFFNAHFVPQVLSVLVKEGRTEGKPPIRSVLDLMVRSILNGDRASLARLNAEFRRHALSAETVVDVYIPAAIDVIGAQWHEDELDILSATIAFARLQTLVRELSRSWHADNQLGSVGSVLMLVPEHDQHVLGALVATGQLRRRGVSVTLKLTSSPYELNAMLDRSHFDAVFVSIASRSCLETAEKLVNLVHRLGNSSLPVIAGGSLPFAAPRLQKATGADHVTCDVSEALRFVGLAGVA